MPIPLKEENRVGLIINLKEKQPAVCFWSPVPVCIDSCIDTCYATNQATSLFQGLVQDPIDCRLIDHLTSLMDPQNDNSYLDIGEFVLIGKKWFDIVRQFPNDEAEINGR